MSYFNSATQKWEDLPIGYEEWSKKKGEKTELGAKTIITDKLLMMAVPEAIQAVGKQLGNSFARALFKGHKLTEKFELMIERDASLRAWEDIIIMEPEFECSPLQYTYMAWQEWNDEYAQRIGWENKSLWQYLKHCFTRTKLFQSLQGRYERWQEKRAMQNW